MKKGFTLIELLAVIVILAIIAVIAVPIVLNIINDTKESATLRSTEFYLDTVEKSIAQAKLKGKNIENGVYNVTKDGNICLDSLVDDECVGEILEVVVKGDKPNSGTITVEDKKITKVDLVINNKEIEKYDGKVVYKGSKKFKIGQEVIFNPGDMERTWYVIDEDETTVTLILNMNLGSEVAWQSSGKNSDGPVTAFTDLNKKTKDWQVESIQSYEYINNKKGTQYVNGYQKLEIKNGLTTITKQDGTLVEVLGETKARILSYDEIFKILEKANSNLKEENLKKYIDRNKEEIIKFYMKRTNSTLDESKKAVDEVINKIYEESLPTRFFDMQSLVYSLTTIEKIEETYDATLPDFLFGNLNEKGWSFHSAYWTISAGFDDSSVSALCVGDKTAENNDVSVSYEEKYPDISAMYPQEYERHGIRPVITISKTDLLNE